MCMAMLHVNRSVEPRGVGVVRVFIERPKLGNPLQLPSGLLNDALSRCPCNLCRSWGPSYCLCIEVRDGKNRDFAFISVYELGRQKWGYSAWYTSLIVVLPYSFYFFHSEVTRPFAWNYKGELSFYHETTHPTIEAQWQVNYSIIQNENRRLLSHQQLS